MKNPETAKSAQSIQSANTITAFQTDYGRPKGRKGKKDREKKRREILFF